MKTCLVLEGGAMRGMYTAGVLDVFYRAGIHFGRHHRCVRRGRLRRELPLPAAGDG